MKSKDLLNQLKDSLESRRAERCVFHTGIRTIRAVIETRFIDTQKGTSLIRFLNQSVVLTQGTFCKSMVIDNGKNPYRCKRTFCSWMRIRRLHNRNSSEVSSYIFPYYTFGSVILIDSYIILGYLLYIYG